MELHEGWRGLYTLQTRPEAIKIWSLCYCCREVVPTSDGAGEKKNVFEVAICLYLCSPLALMTKHLSALKAICHLLSHFCNMSRSSWSLLVSDLVFTLNNRLQRAWVKSDYTGIIYENDTKRRIQQALC